MAYKNTDTTESAKNALYNWSYFSSAVQKLSPIKGQTTNISVHNIAPKEEVDWVKAVVGIGKGSQSIYKAFKGASYTEAEEYFRTHSLKDYQKAVRDNQVPFSHNPVARGVLNEMTGDMVSNIANQEFNAKVARGAFINKTPEELDAAFLEHKRKVFNETKDDYAITSPNDPFFNQGFWGNSDASRVDAQLKNTEVNSKALLEQGIITVQARIKAEILRGASPERINQLYKESEEAFGFYIPLESKMKGVYDGLSLLGDMPNNEATINAWANAKNPYTGNTYIQDYGDAHFDKLRSQSALVTAQNDALADATFIENGERLCRDGNIPALRLKLADEDALYPEVETKRKTQIKEWIRRAVTYDEAKAKENKDASTATKTASLKVQGGSLYVGAVLNGEAPLIEDPIFSGTTQKICKEIVINQLRSGDVDGFLKGASNMEAVWNPYREVLGDKLKNAMTFYKKLRINAEQGIDISNEEMSPELQEMLGLIRANPTAFYRLTNTGSSDYADFITLYTSTLRMGQGGEAGFNWGEVVSGISRWNKLDEKKRETIERNFYSKLGLDVDLTDPNAFKEFSVYVGSALETTGSIKPDDPESAVGLALESFKTQNILHKSTAIPKWWLASCVPTVSSSMYEDLVGVGGKNNNFLGTERKWWTLEDWSYNAVKNAHPELTDLDLSENLEYRFTGRGINVYHKALKNPLYVITKDTVRYCAESMLKARQERATKFEEAKGHKQVINESIGEDI